MYWKVLLFLSIFVPNIAFAAVDYFLKIDGVPGESSVVGHEDEIDILGISWVVSTNRRLTCIEGLDLVKFVDLSSALLLMGQAEGRVYPEAVLTARKAGEAPIEFLVLTLHNAHVGLLSTKGTAGEDRLTENLTLNFERVTYDYTQQNEDGSPGGTVTAELFSRGRCR